MTDNNGDVAVMDLGTLDLNMDSGQFQILANSIMGLGNNKYDPSSDDRIDPVMQLTDQEIITLCRSSSIARRIVEIYPSECSFGNPAMPKTGYYGITPDKIRSYIDDCLRSSNSMNIEDAFRTASKNALKYGVAYIVLGFDDGSLSMAEPLNRDNLKSLEWIEILDKEMLIPDDLYDPVLYQFQTLMTINSFDTKREQLLESSIHSSRVLRFTSKSYDRLELRGQSRFDSVLQSTVAELLVTMKGNRISNQLLLKKALIYAKISTTTGTTQANRDKLQERLGYINLLSSIFRMIGIGENEELNSIQIDLGNVDKVLEKNIDALVASSGIVRTNLLGQPAQQGLGQATSGLENRIEHARRCDQWAVLHWKPKLIYLFDLVTLCQSAPTKGRSIKGLSVDFPSTLTLFPSEWAELRKANAEWAKIHADLGTLNLNEIRVGLFGSAELIQQLIPNITLEEDYDPEAVKEERRKEEQQSLLSKANQPEKKNQQQKKPIQKDGLQNDDSTKAQRKIKWQGYTIALQYLPFQERHKRILPVAYGYIEKLVSPYDGMALDVYVVPRSDLDLYKTIFMLEQYKEGTKEIDEHKGIIGVSTVEEARRVYASVMPTEFMGECIMIPVSELETLAIKKQSKQQNDSFDDCPNYRSVSSGNTCADCIHARWDDKSNPRSWINCDKFDFDIDGKHICDDFDQVNKDGLDLDALEKQLEEFETLTDSDIDETLEDL